MRIMTKLEIMWSYFFTGILSREYAKLRYCSVVAKWDLHTVHLLTLSKDTAI